MNLQKALALGDHGVISIIGAGGKTSLMYSLAAELAVAGKKVLTTTTTKIFMPTMKESQATIVSRSVEEIVAKAKKLVDTHSHVTVGSEYWQTSNKLNGLEPAAIEYIANADLFDFIIIEADGAARRSLKACAPHEPVVPLFSDCVVVVVGLDVLGKPLTEDSVFRSTLFSRNTGVQLQQKVTESSIVSSIVHDMSQVSVSEQGAMKIAFFNKADTVQLLLVSERIEALMEQIGGSTFHRFIIGELRAQSIIHKCKAVQERRGG